jgi:hypothetical protein
MELLIIGKLRLTLKNDADALNEFYRQFPRTESHAFRDESKQAIFNLTKDISTD